ncbi:MAG: DUF4159 domain-containing protein [Flavobacteriales bacterium]|nr:DUF4159 domain-containing protein [Flavobacteriales bacterium]MDG1781075.1 DUF4159 domain-containing protein [Flavobacteriales bacterium]
MKRFLLFFALCASISTFAQTNSWQLAVLKYNGGGDWYGNPSSVPNLADYCNRIFDVKLENEIPYVEVGSPDLFNYPFVHMTGHGNVVFSSSDAENLRNYLIAGGFLHISDNYGMDKYVRQELKKVFPEFDLVELPFSHPIYHQQFDFNQGLPKVHEHDNSSPQGLGLFYEGRLVLFYDYECDLGDGWEDWEVHKDSEELREKSFQMGANMIQYVLMGDEN